MDKMETNKKRSARVGQRRMSVVQATRYLYKSNDSASRELCEEASRQGFGYLVHVQR
jgi:hypothetical protein